MKLTAVVEKGEDGWLIGQIEEIPGAMSQGRSQSELKENLIDALNLYLNVENEHSKIQMSGLSESD